MSEKNTQTKSDSSKKNASLGKNAGGKQREKDGAHNQQAKARTTETDTLAILERVAWQLLFLLPVPILIACPLLIPVILVIVVVRRLRAQRRGPGTSGGSAGFAEIRELKAAGLLGGSGKILGRILAEKPRIKQTVIRLFTVRWSESRAVCEEMRAALLGRRVGPELLIRLNNAVHGMVVGPPGSGKTTTFAILNLLLYLNSIVCIDPKGELFRATARVRKKRHGHRIVRFDPLDVCGSGGARLNPLDFIDRRSPLVADVCWAIAEALVVETGHEHDSHWNDCAKLSICAAILYVVAYAERPDRNLNTVADLLTDGVAFQGMIAAMQDANGDLEATHGQTIVYRLLKRHGNSMANWKDRELSSVLSSVGRHLAWTNSPAVAKHLSASTFDPRKLLKSRTSVYLILPPKYLSGTLSRLMRLWLTTLYAAITECGPQREREILFMLDEVGNVPAVPALYQMLTLGRGFGIRVWLLLQGTGQLKTLFPREGDYQSADASIDNRIFMAIRDYRTAEEISNYLGHTTVYAQSASENQGTSRNGTGAGFATGLFSHSWSKNEGTSHTVSEISRKLLMPDEILRMPADVAILLLKNVRPIKARLVSYFNCPEIADLMPDVDKPLDQPEAVRPTTTVATEDPKPSAA